MYIILSLVIALILGIVVTVVGLCRDSGKYVVIGSAVIGSVIGLMFLYSLLLMGTVIGKIFV